MKAFQSLYMCTVVKRSELGTSAFCHISNLDGVVQLCSTGFNDWGGTSDLGTSAFLHMSN